MVADDMTAVTLDGQQRRFVLPSFPQTKLWVDALHHLGYSTEDLHPVRRAVLKYEVPVPEPIGLDPLLLSASYLLRPHNHPNIRVQPLLESAGFGIVRSMTHRRGDLNGLSDGLNHFQMAPSAAPHTKLSCAYSPLEALSLDKLVEHLTET
jgi:hypothetical protein